MPCSVQTIKAGSARGDARCGSSASTNYQWVDGDVAFLRPESEFSPAQRAALLKSRRSGHKGNGAGGQMDPETTGHPAIILRRLSQRSDHVLVTTVSAHGSGPYNNFLPPWERAIGRGHRDDFRAFQGSERPSNSHPALHLSVGCWPKPKASWVNIQGAYVVPISLLIRFTKARGPLRVHPDSLNDLRRHMEQKCKTWTARMQALRAAEPTPSPAATLAAPSLLGGSCPVARRLVVNHPLPPPPNPSPTPSRGSGTPAAVPAAVPAARRPQVRSWASVAATKR